MKYIVYVLESLASKRKYIGYTSNLEQRLRDHNRGKNKSTKNKGHWKIIYTEENFTERTDAIKRERELKNMKGGIQFKKLINQTMRE